MIIRWGIKSLKADISAAMRWIKQYVVDNVDKSGEEGAKMYSRQAVGSGRKLDRKK